MDEGHDDRTVVLTTVPLEFSPATAGDALAGTTLVTPDPGRAGRLAKVTDRPLALLPAGSSIDAVNESAMSKVAPSDRRGGKWPLPGRWLTPPSPLSGVETATASRCGRNDEAGVPTVLPAPPPAPAPGPNETDGS